MHPSIYSFSFPTGSHPLIPPPSLCPFLLSGTTAAFVYSLVPNLTYLAFAARYIERVEEENAAWPSLKEMRVYYSLYRAKHGGTGPYHEIIEQAREGEVEGEESNEAFRFLLGLFLNQHHDRGT